MLLASSAYLAAHSWAHVKGLKEIDSYASNHTPLIFPIGNMGLGHARTNKKIIKYMDWAYSVTRPSLSETAKFDAKMTITHLLVHFLQDFFTSKSHQNLCTTCTNKYGGIYKKFPYNINSYSLNYSGKKKYIYINNLSLSIQTSEKKLFLSHSI